MAEYDIVKGTVTQVNDNGFKLDGEEDWINPSKFAKPKPQIPPLGAEVEVALDQKGFARKITVLGGVAAAPSGGGGGGSGLAGEQYARLQALQIWASWYGSREDGSIKKVFWLAEQTAEWIQTGKQSDRLKQFLAGPPQASQAQVQAAEKAPAAPAEQKPKADPGASLDGMAPVLETDPRWLAWVAKNREAEAAGVTNAPKLSPGCTALALAGAMANLEKQVERAKKEQQAVPA